jgi:alpha-amylase
LKKINFILGIHNHQPVGNFDFVFEEAYKKAYEPFLDMLARFPSVKVGMHFTGILYDWIGRTYPEFLTRLRAMVESGQIEIIGGGFYEPIMAVIPDHDKLGQIKKLSSYCEEKLGVKPQGMWVAERVWEPHLPKPIHQASMRYVILDDTHFKYTGLEEEDLTGYFVTEEEGYKIDVFPISKTLRYTIPFREPEKTIEYLKELATEDGRRIAVFADDGEKFGIWPETYKHVYEDGWLEKFFTLLEKNKRWIRLIHFSEALKEIKPVGRVYVPTSSYSEMQHWALPVKSFRAYEVFEEALKEKDMYDDFGIFVRGGFWRNFSVKYPEANRMHKKMLRLSNRIQMLKAVIITDSRGSAEEKAQMLEKAQDHLWASQCNCPYWHGVFGGIYLNNIRYAMYKEMLQCENFLDVIENGDNSRWRRIERADYNADGRDELLIETKDLNLYIDPEHGAGIFELSYKDVPINLGDTMTRREEGYHKKLADTATSSTEPKANKKENEIASIHDLALSKEKNLHEYLLYDKYTRQSFLDRIIPVNSDAESFYKGRFEEMGTFVDEAFEVKDLSNGEEIKVEFSREGSVRGSGLFLKKTLSLIPGTTQFTVNYQVHNRDHDLDVLFGTELNVTMLAGKADDRYYYVAGQNLTDRQLASKGSNSQVTEMGMIDRWLSVNLNLKPDRPCELWRFPVETISLSEEGFERVYQQSCLFPHWRLSLKPKEIWSVNITLTLSRNIDI